MVSYDLKSPEDSYDYTLLIQNIKKYAWAHILDSQWLINTNKTTLEICNELSQFVDKNDVLLVNPFDLKNSFECNLSTQILNWIESESLVGR